MGKTEANFFTESWFREYLKEDTVKTGLTDCLAEQEH